MKLRVALEICYTELFRARSRGGVCGGGGCRVPEKGHRVQRPLKVKALELQH